MHRVLVSVLNIINLPAGGTAEAHMNKSSSQMGTAPIKKVQCMDTVIFLRGKIHKCCYVVCKIAVKRFKFKMPAGS